MTFQRDMTLDLSKPVRGEALVASRVRRAGRKSAEDKEMQAAKRRDGNVCRNPACPHRSRNLPIDPAHQTHRGMGGDPKGTRTTQDQIIALCRACHGLWDAGQMEIHPVKANGFNGPASWHYPNPETGVMEQRFVESAIGVSVARSA